MVLPGRKDKTEVREEQGTGDRRHGEAEDLKEELGGFLLRMPKPLLDKGFHISSGGS